MLNGQFVKGSDRHPFRAFEVDFVLPEWRSTSAIDPDLPVANVFFRAVELLIARVHINGSSLAAITQKGYQTSGIRRNRTLCWYSA